MPSEDDSSSNELDLEDIDIWKISRKKGSGLTGGVNSGEIPESRTLPPECVTIHMQKFESLKNRSRQIQEGSRRCREKTEKRRSEKLIRKASKDPLVKKLIENDDVSDLATDSRKQKWEDIKPFLTVNDHLQGLVSHGDIGPKTELEILVDDAIEEGDFTKAEVLSDTLANRQFAVKISQAFKAKRYAEKIAIEEEEKKAKRLKKLPWGFEAKERWQMKGNM